APILEGKDVYPVLLDSNDEVISFPPIINGILTTVTDDTENLFLDLTGTDFRAINLALNILSTMLADTGAKIESVKVNYQGGENIVTPNLNPKKWEVNINYINDYIGLNLSAIDMIKCFRKVRMDAKKSKKKGCLDVWVPAFRGDIMHPVDFTEECAIGYGYFNLPLTIREGCFGEYHPIQSFANKIRAIMIGAGYLEVLNFILTNSKRHYDYMKQEYKESKLIQIANPVSKEYDTARTRLLPKLMETLLFNRSEEKPIRIFETGDVILLAPEQETGAKREVHLSAVTYHELDFIMTSLNYYNNFEIKPGKNASYINGRYGDIYINNEKVGEIGEIHPEVLLNFKLEFPVAALELNLQFM
ncbi:MAG: phenylalanine--tRNA ligase subunit beta, partial [Promethearchaeota archaeon]